MANTFGMKRIDRRALFVGGASLAAGGALLQAGEAAASADDLGWTLGHVTALIAANAVDVTPLDQDQSVRVDIMPGAPVFADLTPGSGVVAQGEVRTDGSVAATRVVQGVFGVASDVPT
jgi:hypothetical protein